MTTRITLAILLTTWVVLIVGEAAAFLTARATLVALLDSDVPRWVQVAPGTEERG